MFSNVRVASILIPLAVAGVLAGNVPAAHASTGAAQCQGEGVDAAARIRYRADIVINAPLSRIFALQTRVERWPDWQQPVLSSKRLDHGPLRAGSSWRWTTPAPATDTTPATTMHITSTLRRVKREACLLWSGPAVGTGVRIDRGVHLWTFTEVNGGVRVHTEETWTGAQVEADVATSTELLGAGLEAWLRDLKAAAESR
ncbi:MULTISPECIES: SRPBCC family protein [unclassified Nonomuraea]|uniref:SRPBCC family protein n=1 Tax=unclassified Nonomuraea TaxID=2593643 RepID=UPI0033E254CF